MSREGRGAPTRKRTTARRAAAPNATTASLKRDRWPARADVGNHLSKVWRSRAWVKTRSAKSSRDLHAFHEEPKRQRALPQNCDRDDERRDVHPQVRSEHVRERIDQVTRPAEHEQDTKQARNQGRPSDEIPYRHDLKPEKHHLNVEALRWRVRLDERERRSAR